MISKEECRAKDPQKCRYHKEYVALKADSLELQNFNAEREKIVQDLNLDQLNQLRIYKESMYFNDLNQSLYDAELYKEMANKTAFSEEERIRKQNIIDQMREGLDSVFLAQNAPRAPEPRVLYRYYDLSYEIPALDITNFKQIIKDYYPNGKIVSFDGFSSTTIDPGHVVDKMQKTDPRRHVIFKITTDKGLAVPFQSDNSQSLEPEKEVLLQRGLKFSVAKVILGSQFTRVDPVTGEETIVHCVVVEISEV